MANSTETAERVLALEIRKLRKKIRQIENLELLDRPLTAEEKDKVNKKSSIRLELLEKIEQQVTTATYRIIPSASPPDEQSLPKSSAQEASFNSSDDPIEDNEDNEVVEEIHVEEMKRKADDDQEEGVCEEQLEVRDRGDDKRTRYEDDKRMTQEERGQDGLQETKDYKTGKKGDEAVAHSGTPSNTKKKSHKRKKEGSPPTDKGWADVKFLVRELEGHNDLVCAVACQGSTVISGGRDTMVKLWDSDTGAEIRSLGGHTGTITSLMIIPPQLCQRLASVYDIVAESDTKFALTGSTDCSIRLWCLSTGEMLRSIYTYNSVECMGLIQDNGFIVSGSDGGKVELWDVETGDSVFTTIGHDEGVTCIKVEGQLVITTSADGFIKLWQLRDKSLHTMYASETVTCQSSSKPVARRHIKSLVYRHGIYYGDDGLNVKVLDWKKGVVHKLKNHLGDFGTTNAMCSTGDLLACAGYDLDNGQAYINFWSLPEEVYLATLNDQDTSRVITMDCTTTDMGYLRIVTGGQQVKVWDRIPKKRYSPQDAVPIEFLQQYSTRALDSDVDSDTDSDTDDAETEARHHGRRRWSDDSGEQTGWLGSWCTVV